MKQQNELPIAEVSKMSIAVEVQKRGIDDFLKFKKFMDPLDCFNKKLKKLKKLENKPNYKKVHGDLKTLEEIALKLVKKLQLEKEEHQQLIQEINKYYGTSAEDRFIILSSSGITSGLLSPFFWCAVMLNHELLHSGIFPLAIALTLVSIITLSAAKIVYLNATSSNLSVELNGLKEIAASKYNLFSKNEDCQNDTYEPLPKNSSF